VLNELDSDRFVDRAPGEVVATLLDEGRYLCSERTMYRILAERSPVRDRRDQLRHPSYAKPELVSSGPNEVWSWDITKLLGPRTWTYYYLYVLLDIYSRYVVGWMIADRENSVLAGRLIAESCTKHGVQPKVLTLHSDRGSPMTSHHTAQLLADLGVTRSLRRPQVSNDNPFLRIAVQGAEVPPGLPEPIRRYHHGPGVLPQLLPLVQRRAPARRHLNADARGGPLREGHRGSHRSASGPECRPRSEPGAVPRRRSNRTTAAERGVHQPTKPSRRQHQRGQRRQRRSGCRPRGAGLRIHSRARPSHGGDRTSCDSRPVSPGHVPELPVPKPGPPAPGHPHLDETLDGAAPSAPDQPTGDDLKIRATRPTDDSAQ